MTTSGVRVGNISFTVQMKKLKPKRPSNGCDFKIELSKAL